MSFSIRICKYVFGSQLTKNTWGFIGGYEERRRELFKMLSWRNSFQLGYEVIRRFIIIVGLFQSYFPLNIFFLTNPLNIY